MAAAPATEAMEATANTLYYLGLYLLVVVVRFFKVKTDEKDKRFSRVFHVSLEIVYTASGLVILLLNDLKAYQPFILIAYIILVIVSSQIESFRDTSAQKSVTAAHIFVILLIAVVTVYYFQYVVGSAQKKIVAASDVKHDDSPTQHSYRVIIPYIDESLENKVGRGNMSGRYLAFVTTVNAASSAEGRYVAEAKFKTEVKPFGKSDAGASVFPREELLTIESTADVVSTSNAIPAAPPSAQSDPSQGKSKDMEQKKGTE